MKTTKTLNTAHVLPALLGAALPPLALLAYSGGELTGRNIATVPLIALAALLSFQIASTPTTTDDSHDSGAPVFFALLALSCLACAAARTLL